MPLNKLIFSVAFPLLFFSCSHVRSVGTNSKSFYNRYSLDKLPDDWKKPSTLKAIDDIIPTAIQRLKNTRSCMNCKAGFWITVQLDSLFMIDQSVHDKTVWEFGSAVDGHEITCTFRFKSHLSVLDSTGTEIARLVVVDPEEDIYRITGDPYENGRRSSLFNYRKDFSGAPLGLALIPTDNELLNFTKQKLKVIQDRIQKLQSLEAHNP